MNVTQSEIASFTFDVMPLAAALGEWRAHEDRLTSSTAQSVTWVSNWEANVNADCIAITARSASCLELVLVLEVINKGPLKVARFAGGSHANENFPAMSAAFCALPPEQAANAVMNIIKLKRPDIDLVELSRMIKSLDGFSNALIDPARAIQSERSLSFSIRHGFKSVLDANNGSKKQKKIRQMARRMEERGGWTIRRAETAEDAIAILKCFYWLKAKRLAEKGIDDVFGRQEVKVFFDSIFSRDAGQNDQSFELHVLEVGGAHVAIAGCTLRKERFTVDFGAISDTDANLSPGDFLYFHLIETICARGFEVFSFGTGDEPYKRSWCDVETDQFEVFLPLSLKGKIGASIDKLKASAKRAIKSNTKLFALAKSIRKKL